MHNKVVTRDTFTQPRPEKTLGTRLTFTVVKLMILLPQGTGVLSMTGRSRDKFTKGNTHGYVKKNKETAHDI